MNLTQLQQELKPWVKHNFGDRPDWHPLLGVVEEIGELAHARLKSEQKIRTNEDHNEKEKDAIGDAVVYLADYCNARGFDFGGIVLQVWNSVKIRDWKKFPKNGIDK